MAELKAAPVYEGTAGHWYTADGQAAYEVAKTDGTGTRPTTLRDARKLKLLPSVTMVLGILEKPQLAAWKQKQAIRAAVTLPRNEGEEEEAWMDRVIEKAGEPAAEAADLGSRIHEAIEAACAGQEWDTVALGPYVAPVLGWLVGQLAKGGKIVAQESIITDAEDGFAGKTDLVIEYPDRRILVVDWKSRKTRPGESDRTAFAPYPTQRMQGAAYAAHWAKERGWDLVGCVNVITSSTEPGRFGVAAHDAPEASWEAFRAVLEIWRWARGYDPRTTGAGG